jgi:hypothetical protein
MADAASRKPCEHAAPVTLAGIFRARMSLSARFPAAFLLTVFPLGSKTGRYLFSISPQ